MIWDGARRLSRSDLEGLVLGILGAGEIGIGVGIGIGVRMCKSGTCNFGLSMSFESFGVVFCVNFSKKLLWLFVAEEFIVENWSLLGFVA